MVIFYKNLKNVQLNLINKKRNGLEQSKNENSSTLLLNERQELIITSISKQLIVTMKDKN